MKKIALLLTAVVVLLAGCDRGIHMGAGTLVKVNDTFEYRQDNGQTFVTSNGYGIKSNTLEGQHCDSITVYKMDDEILTKVTDLEGVNCKTPKQEWLNWGNFHEIKIPYYQNTSNQCYEYDPKTETLKGVSCK